MFGCSVCFVPNFVADGWFFGFVVDALLVEHIFIAAAMQTERVRVFVIC